MAGWSQFDRSLTQQHGRDGVVPVKNVLTCLCVYRVLFAVAEGFLLSAKSKLTGCCLPRCQVITVAEKAHIFRGDDVEGS